MGRILEWIEELLYMCDDGIRFENPDYGNQDRTEEFLKSCKFIKINRKG